jgi:hypothetical protein
MTDFYTLLKQSIIDRDIRDANDREAVYAQARQAILKQLWAHRPPLAADEIDTRVEAYDDAVDRIERDLRAVYAAEVNPAGDDDGPYAEPEPVSDVQDRAEDEIDAPPLAEWRHGEFDDAAPEDDAVDGYESTPAVLPARASSRAAAGDARSAAHRSAARDHDHASGENETYEEDSQKGGRTRYHSRWTDDGEIVSVRPWWLPVLDEAAKVKVLAGAISALAVLLAVLGGYLFFSRGTSDAQAVTLDIGVRREVSDAATASRIGSEALDVVQAYSLFDGRDPTIFATTPDNPVRYVSDGGGYARISSSASSPGVKAIIGPGLAERLAGQRVRVTLLARSSTDFGAGAMRFAYQSGLAISHWQTANLTADYQPVGIIWRVPTMRTNPAGDYLVIEPGIPGDGTGVDIQSIKIDVLPAEAS